MKVIDFSSFSIKLLNFQIGRTRSIIIYCQDKSTNTTPFLRFSGATFHMDAFKVVLDDSWCHIWGYHYAKPIYSQSRNTNVHIISTIIHILTNLVSLNVYGVNLSLVNIWEDLTRLVPIFVEYEFRVSNKFMKNGHPNLLRMSNINVRSRWDATNYVPKWGSASNGDHSMNDTTFSESAVPHVCLACNTSLCCSLVWYVTDVSCCIALFTLVQAGTGRYQPSRWGSVMLLPLVRPSLVSRLLVSTCSITRYANNPAQNWLLLLTTYTPWVNCLWTLGYVSSSLVIYFRYTYWGSM